MISNVIDMFETDVRFSDKDETRVTGPITTNERAMEQFVLNFAPDVMILRPERLRKKIVEKLKNAVEAYGGYHMKKNIKNEKYDKLLNQWSDLLDLLPQGIDQSVYDELKHLIFDTYHFCKDILSDKQDIPREKLVLYKYIAQMCSLFSFGLSGINSEALGVAYADALQGLCFAIEEGFDVGYIENPLRMGFTIYIGAGAAASEADMTSYESFDAALTEYAQMLIEDYDYDDYGYED